jgi:hypothetical protein
MGMGMGTIMGMRVRVRVRGRRNGDGPKPDPSIARPPGQLWGLWRIDPTGPYRYGDWIKTMDSHSHACLMAFDNENEAKSAAGYYSHKIRNLSGDCIRVTAEPLCGCGAGGEDKDMADAAEVAEGASIDGEPAGE